jgi:hypothetical protein
MAHDVLGSTGVSPVRRTKRAVPAQKLSSSQTTLVLPEAKSFRIPATLRESCLAWLTWTSISIVDRCGGNRQPAVDERKGFGLA